MDGVLAMLSSCLCLLQDESDANILPEFDMVMVVNAVSAAWDLLYQHHAHLLHPFLEHSGTATVLQ